MNKNKIRSALKTLTEQTAPAAGIDLWPALESRIQMNQSKKSKGFIMNKEPESKHRKLQPAFILLILVVIGAVFFILPPGRSLAQEILHFFINGKTNYMPGPTSTPVEWVEQTPGVAAVVPTQAATPTQSSTSIECASITKAECSIEQIREMASFPVYAFAELPEGMYFTGATGKSDQVLLFYQSDLTYMDGEWKYGYLTVQETPLTNELVQLAWQVGADADIQEVKIGEITGEYVVGSYNGTDGPPVWDPNSGDQTIRWVDHGILFTVDMLGELPNLTRDELGALGATLTDGPVGVNGVPVAKTEEPSSEAADFNEIYPLSLAEAEEKAGFTLITPSRLPETLLFAGASFDEQTNVVNVFYRYNDPDFPGNTDGLMVREQLKPEGTYCELCSFIPGTYGQNVSSRVVGADAKIETIQAGQYSGQYLEGVGWAASDSSGWHWETDAYVKRVRFQTDDLAVEIKAFSSRLEKEDLLAIVESMQ
jgi:hypothetical protein